MSQWTPLVQREFMNNLGVKLNFSHWEDWYNVKTADFITNGGRGILSHHKNSPSKLVTTTFPSHPWDLSRFKFTPMRYWKDTSNHRLFLNNLFKKLGYERIEHWYQVKCKDFYDNGGSGLLTYYGNSPSRMIMENYSEYNWNLSLFDSTPAILRRKLWTIDETRDYFEKFLSSRNKAVDRNSLITISIHEVLSDRNGSLLLKQHDNDLIKALRRAFPEITFVKKDFVVFSFTSKPQQLIYHFLSKNLEIDVERNDVINNYKHSLPKQEGDKKNKIMELDIWIPKYKFALEYQGEQHYLHLMKDRSMKNRNKRDEEKVKECKRIGIDLVVIPFWWDRSEAQLINAIRKCRPDIVKNSTEIT